MRRALHIRKRHVQSSMVGGWCIPEARGAITAAVFISKNDFDTVTENSTLKHINNKKFIITHNEKSLRLKL